MMSVEPDLIERCAKYVRHAAALCHSHSLVIDTEQGNLLSIGTYCEGCDFSKCNAYNTHNYGAGEASRWGGRYIYYCPLGLVFCAASVHAENGAMRGALVAGPLLMGERSDALDALPLDKQNSAQFLPVTSTEHVFHLSELLAACAGFVSAPLSSYGTHIYNQEKLQNAIYDAKVKNGAGGNEFAIQLEYENKLATLIASRDKSGAQGLLNELLGHMYFAARYDLGVMKARALELLVVITRAAAKAGGEAEKLFFCTPDSIDELMDISSFDQLCIRLGIMLHKFISCAFEIRHAHHCDAVFKTMEYIRRNCRNRITLDDVAKNVTLSRSYISTIFKEQTGQSIVSFINRARVEHAKKLLLDNAISLVDIAGLCGFEDQSYFTSVFKKVTGITPKRFRDSRGTLN